MRPLLKDYKLCKYMNKFYVSANTAFNLAASVLVCPPTSQPVHGGLCRRALLGESTEHLAYSLYRGLRLAFHTPLPSTSHLEIIIKTYATLTSLTSPSWPGGKRLRSQVQVISPGLGNKFLVAFTATSDKCFKQAFLVNNSAYLSVSFIPLPLLVVNTLSLREPNEVFNII